MNSQKTILAMVVIIVAASLAAAPSLMNHASADPKTKCTGPGNSCNSQGDAQDHNKNIKQCHSNSPNSANHKCVGND